VGQRRLAATGLLSGAIVWGALAALGIGAMTLACSRALETARGLPVLAGLHAISAVLAVGYAVTTGWPRAGATSVLWATISGVAIAAGAALWFAALRRERVSVVSAIVGADGAMTAIIAVLAGERLSPVTAAGLALIVVGATVLRAPPRSALARVSGPAVLLCFASALMYAVSFATLDAGRELGVVWAVGIARIAAVVPLLIACFAASELTVPRVAVRWVLIAGVCNVVGVVAFLTGAGGSLAVSAMLTSQHGTVGVLGAVLLLGERLSRLQSIGVGVTLAGVAIVAAG
jgi:drug/metabolite transporter (DMT)-like permease